MKSAWSWCQFMNALLSWASLMKVGLAKAVLREKKANATPGRVGHRSLATIDRMTTTSADPYGQVPSV
jgi:hypothetical protein